ncbi:hypothetical protein P171DRAFT_235507 [Karstenula rhodostoma CBS 690.94]|uniref:Uncharacterized protein n=1 Tax=Karstenula rhodostoma CBS 690.94 TaxID=1392251 RepID=A0A9P4UFB9_9PLEO|nr:hypothetical protein P171DRAFT_235507 [Karstenula rhodostoma CBS 690.94]
MSLPTKGTDAMQQRSGSTHHHGTADSTSRKVGSSSSKTGYSRTLSNGEYANRRQSPSQSRVTQYTGYTPNHSRPVVVHHYQKQSNESQGWQTVPRSWTNMSPAASHHAQHPALDRNPLAPSPNRGGSSQGDSIQGTMNRLTLAELDLLSEQHARMNTMDRWRSESQRDRSWDGMGYLRSAEDGRNGW